jgi:hypothetical protein
MTESPDVPLRDAAILITGRVATTAGAMMILTEVVRSALMKMAVAQGLTATNSRTTETEDPHVVAPLKVGAAEVMIADTETDEKATVIPGAATESAQSALTAVQAPAEKAMADVKNPDLTAKEKITAATEATEERPETARAAQPL